EPIGAISPIVGTVLVGITLIYLAVQLRQNTTALKSSTFLAISTLMGSTMEVWATHSDLAPLLIKAQAGLDELSPNERARFGFLMMMAFRRVETVVVQRHLGFIDPELTEGFERSALSALNAKGMRQWWDASKSAFSNLFQHGSIRTSPRTCLDRSTLGLVSVFQRIRWQMTRNHPMKPTPSSRCKFSVFATTPCRGLSLSR